MSFVYIDLEASGLGPDSYPIEVAWKDSADGSSDNFLIDPARVEGWDYWDEFAEELHGIAPEDLAGQLCARESARRLNRSLLGRKVISDALEFDSFWMRRLFAAAEMKPSFDLVGLEHVLAAEQLVQYRMIAKTQLRRHRAMRDVEDLMKAVSLVLGESLTG
ncbi:3'-5' exonuclease [Marinobacterium jannaschii]|uniref:3'-5' exonuclease n=1 Tax=Marinobacterium jannaschii TaxID=64970 RepID=UPI000480418B|nr:hypothetical protein [Marinobacterium jannaschii]